MEFLYQDVIYALLIFIRISGIFFLTPFFSSTTIPVKIKLGFVFFITLIVFNFVPKTESIFVNLNYYTLVVLCLKELLIGLLIGYFLLVVFSIAQVSAQVYSMDMGFAMVNVFDPISQIQIPVLGQYKYLFLLSIFFIFGVHRKIIFLLVDTFEKYQLGSISYSNERVLFSVVENFSYFFMLAVKMALPILGVLFLINLILGVMARIAPQMNVFFIGMPLKIMVGFTILILFTPYMIAFMISVLENGYYRIVEIIREVVS